MCISPGDSSRDLSIPYLVGGYLSGLDFWSPLTIAKKGHQELPGIYSRKPTNVDTEKASLLIQEISSRTKRHQFSGAFRRGLSGVGIYIYILSCHNLHSFVLPPEFTNMAIAGKSPNFFIGDTSTQLIVFPLSFVSELGS